MYKALIRMGPQYQDLPSNYRSALGWFINNNNNNNLLL